MWNQAQAALCHILVGNVAAVDWAAFGPDDWQQLKRIAQAQGIAPLVYQTFNHSGWPTSAPQSLRKDLAGEYYAAASQNMLFYQELARVLLALANAQVPTVVLKGAVLAATIYPNVALRPMGDLDLLIPRERLAQATAALTALGYEAEKPEIGRGLTNLVTYEANFDLASGPPIHVELHWNLIGGDASRYKPRIDWFWEQTEPITLSGVPTLTLTPTAHFLYLAAHLLLKHGGTSIRLLWLYDLHLLAAHYIEHLDWDELFKQAREFHWLAAVRNTFLRLQACFATPLPQRVQELLGEGSGEEDLQDLPRESGDLQTRTFETLQDLSSLTTPVRLRVLLALVFPSVAYMRWRYKPEPAWIWPICYVYRWADILNDGVRTLKGLAIQHLNHRKRRADERHGT